MQHLVLLFVSLLFVVPRGIVHAQQPRVPLFRGQPVRLTAPALGLTHQMAVFRTLRNDTLVVVVGDSVVPCPVAVVTGLEMSRGQRSWAGVGALFGTVAGAGLGVALRVGALAPLCEEDGGTCTGAAIAGGALLGMMVGGLIGNGVKTERWEEVPLARLRMMVAGRLDRHFVAGVSVRF